MTDKSDKKALALLRNHINELDNRLVSLLDDRASVAHQIAEVKRDEGLSVFDAVREESVLKRVAERMHNGHQALTETAVRTIYQAIIRECRAVQADKRIAVLGPAGSFSHLAATGYFGAGQDYSFARTIGEAIDELADQESGSCVAPIENSMGGVVGETLDMLWEKDVRVVAQLHMKIHHHLIAQHPVQKLKVIRSKVQVLHQCHRWLHRYAPGVTLEETSSSSQAVSMAAEDPAAGALGSSLAATLFSLPIQERNVHDDPNNETRFFVLQAANSSTNETTPDMGLAAILFTLPHKSGSLVDALQIFARHDVNLKHIVSRPMRTTPWEYVFEVELELPKNVNLDILLQELSAHAIYMRSLGRYLAIAIEGN